MSFYIARISAFFSPADGASPICLVRAGHDILTEQPVHEWDLPTDSRDFCASAWGEDVPTGNARARLTLSILYEAPSEAQAILYMRDREFILAAHRSGSLTLDEAYQSGVPTLRTTWRAVVTQLDPSPLLDPQDAVSDPDHPDASLRGAANALLKVTFSLTNPITSRLLTHPDLIPLPEPDQDAAEDEDA